MNLNGVELPALPEGKRWYIGRDLINAVTLNIQEQHSFLGIKYWKTISWAWIHGTSEWELEQARRKCLYPVQAKTDSEAYERRNQERRNRVSDMYPTGEVK